MVDLVVMRSKCNDLMWLKRQNKGSAGTVVVKLLIKKGFPLTPGRLFFFSNVKVSSERETFFKKVH